MLLHCDKSRKVIHFCRAKSRLLCEIANCTFKICYPCCMYISGRAICCWQLFAFQRIAKLPIASRLWCLVYSVYRWNVAPSWWVINATWHTDTQAYKHTLQTSKAVTYRHHFWQPMICDLERLNRPRKYTGWAKKVIPLVQCNII